MSKADLKWMNKRIKVIQKENKKAGMNDYRHGDIWICSVTGHALLFRDGKKYLEYNWAYRSNVYNDGWSVLRDEEACKLISEWKNYELIYREYNMVGEPWYEKGKIKCLKEKKAKKK